MGGGGGDEKIFPEFQRGITPIVYCFLSYLSKLGS